MSRILGEQYTWTVEEIINLTQGLNPKKVFIWGNDIEGFVTVEDATWD